MFWLKKGKTEEESIELIEKKQARCNNTEAIKLLFKSKAVDFYAWNKVFKKLFLMVSSSLKENCMKIWCQFIMLLKQLKLLIF